MNRYARRTGQADVNEADIIRELKDRGAIVVVIDKPTDLVVGYLGVWTFVEVKASPKSRIRKTQLDFLVRCGVHGLPCVIMDDLDDCDLFFPIPLETAAPRYAQADDL